MPTKPTNTVSRPPRRNHGLINTEFRAVGAHTLDPSKLHRNIENFIGAAQVPIGLAGPIKVLGDHANGNFHVPFATTEGTLVSGYTLGMIAVSRCGGVRVKVLSHHTDVSPVFELPCLDESARFAAWLSDHMSELDGVCRTQTRNSTLIQVRPLIAGRRVFVFFAFDTRDAMGLNSISIATEHCCRYIREAYPAIVRYYLRSNLSADKKPAFTNFINGYGKEVSAEVTIRRSVAQRILGATPEQMCDFWHASVISGFQAGTIGHNAQYANALAAIFVACGQDVAQIINACQGITTCELDRDANAYFCVRLPCLIVGTVGGGTHLPTQRECLEQLGCYGADCSDKFAEIVAATLLAGEISIGAALASGKFIQAHIRKRQFPLYNARDRSLP